jgi:glycosyltransferase domain-containing protein
MSLRYVIRTLDRPEDLKDLLRYLSDYSPQLGLVVIDGSEKDVQEINRAEISRYANRLSVETISIPSGTPIVERTVAGLRAIPDEFIFVGADDDLPCIEFIEQAEALITSGNVGTKDKVFGDQVKMSLLSMDYIRLKKLSVPDADDEDPMVRIRRLIQHYQPLVYGVFGREALIEEYLMTGDVLMAGPQIYDFALGERFMGAIAVARGKLHYIPGLSLIRLIKSERHETVRDARYPTLFMPNSYERAWSAVNHLSNAMFGDFKEQDPTTQQKIVREVHDLATGRRGRPDMSSNERWVIGDALIRQCFLAETPEFIRYNNRLIFARDCLLAAFPRLVERLRQINPLLETLPSPSDVQETLRKAGQINASSWGMLIDLHTMTMAGADQESEESLQSRKERRLAKKMRLNQTDS